jgi:hypothetical protein
MVDPGTPDVCRSLLFSVLCFSFTNPDWKELREREKEKKKKWQINRGSLTLLSIVLKQQTDRQASSSCLTQVHLRVGQ